MCLLHNLCHCRLLARPAAMSEFLTRWSSLLDDLPTGSPYVTAAVPLIVQLTGVVHVSADPHCIAALVGLLHFLTAPDTFCAPPPTLRTPCSCLLLTSQNEALMKYVSSGCLLLLVSPCVAQSAHCHYRSPNLESPFPRQLRVCSTLAAATEACEGACDAC